MAKKTGELTPLMKQYWDVKTVHADKIVFFRMGDFFELFYDDAVSASQVLGLTLTQRNKKSEDHTPMCGFPHHSLAGYVNKLLSVGHKIAICDQVEDAALAKGLVKRAVTRVLTPGMVFDNETLEATSQHYMACVGPDKIVFLDSSTGEFFHYDMTDAEKQVKTIELLPVAELILDEKYFQASLAFQNFKQSRSSMAWTFFAASEDVEKNLLLYVESLNQDELLKNLKSSERRFLQEHMKVSSTTLRHLEIFQNYRADTERTLFQTIQKTKTASGSRLLRQWLMFPLKNKSALVQRQDQIEKFRQNMFELKKVREILSTVGDIERRLNKIMQPQAHARDLISLAESTLKALETLNWAQKIGVQIQSFQLSAEKIEALTNLSREIVATFHNEAPLSTKQGFMINTGLYSELDELIRLSTDSHQLLQEMETREKERTGISSLKIRYNNVFGYYIEVTNTHKDKVPADYQRKQTLANAERFCTDELIDLERKVLSAQKKRFDLEFEIFENFRKKILSSFDPFISVAHQSSEVDVYAALAWLSLENNYCRPEFHEDKSLHLISARHAVVEQVLRDQFIPNTVQLTPAEILLLTGPNMAGKSTLMRQVALIILLAQMGSYVPCEQAKMPLYDALFTRIGASDHLSEGLSTFMVEMTETAQMLSEATANSLLILDEVGRGTGTFDGMSLAQALVEHLNQKVQCQVFFATHYHELSSLENSCPAVRNAHMKVHEAASGQIEFLYILSEGPAGKSYGIKVAQLAGLPQSLTERAYHILHKYESQDSNNEVLQVKEKPVSQKALVQQQISFFDQEKDSKQRELIEKIKEFNVSHSTPIHALNQIVEWKKIFEI